jgi:hypothetical protein
MTAVKVWCGLLFEQISFSALSALPEKKPFASKKYICTWRDFIYANCFSYISILHGWFAQYETKYDALCPSKKTSKGSIRAVSHCYNKAGVCHTDPNVLKHRQSTYWEIHEHSGYCNETSRTSCVHTALRTQYYVYYCATLNRKWWFTIINPFITFWKQYTILYRSLALNVTSFLWLHGSL